MFVRVTAVVVSCASCGVSCRALSCGVSCRAPLQCVISSEVETRDTRHGHCFKAGHFTYWKSFSTALEMTGCLCGLQQLSCRAPSYDVSGRAPVAVCHVERSIGVSCRAKSRHETRDTGHCVKAGHFTYWKSFSTSLEMTGCLCGLQQLSCRAPVAVCHVERHCSVSCRAKSRHETRQHSAG
jgi:hypothetical protein